MKTTLATRPARLTKPLPPAAALPALPATGAINASLKTRLENAVAALAGKARQRVDAHDKSQARRLLAAHPDKLHLVAGAGKLVEVENEETDLLD